MANGAGALPGESASEHAPQGGKRAAGLSWTWELDFETLLAALQEPPPWSGRSAAKPAQASQESPAEVDPAEVDQVEAEFAELLSAMEDGRSRVVPLTTVAGQVAESLPTGPDLAGWLATGAEDQLEDGALVGVAASYRRLASWAQAGELAAVAELTSRSASADERIGTDEQGRPARLPDEACAQVSLALTMSHSRPMEYLRPAHGMLDLRLPWGTLAGESAEPGYLGQLGPITPTQARQLADLAAGDPAADWRVVVTGADGRALSVGRVPRKPARAGPVGLVKRVTVSITREELARSAAADLPPAWITPTGRTYTALPDSYPA